jgi:urease accessory protein
MRIAISLNKSQLLSVVKSAMIVGAGVSGLLHPLLTPTHMVVLISLSLIAGRNFVPSGAAIIGAFALGLVAGLGAIACGVGETPANDMLLASATLCGLMAASDITVPVPLVVPVMLMSGGALGLDSPPQSISLSEAVAMLIGTACGALAALTIIAFVASRMARVWKGIALRVAGSWVAAIAILVLALRWVA